MANKKMKQQVLDICLEKQEKQVENLTGRVEATRSDINDSTYSASQSEDRKAGKTEMLRIYESELAFSTADLNYLKSLDVDAAYDTVQPGSLVVTNNLIFYVAISTEKFELDGKPAVGISVNAPIYQSMTGLSKGDSFHFNDAEYLIEELY